MGVRQGCCGVRVEGGGRVELYLQWGGNGIVAVLVHGLEAADEMGWPHGPAKLPPGGTEHLPSTPNRHGPLPHPGQRGCGKDTH